MKGPDIRYNVLIIEDNPGDYVLIEDYLEETTIVKKLHWAENFNEAKKILTENNSIDIILLDLSLPDKDGEPLIKGIQLFSNNKPIIILTGYPDADFAIKSLALGASDYLLKDVLNSTVLHKSIIYNIERNKILVNLRRSEQRYSDLFHFSPLPMWVFDRETLNFLDVNDAAIAHYGYTYKEFLSMDITQIRAKADMPILVSALDKVKEAHENLYHGEITHIKKNGDYIRVEVRSNSFEYKGRPAEIILVNDVTERNQHIEAIEKQNDILKDIAWTQSHVVRAPLARLLGLVNLLSDGKIGESEKKDFYKYIQDSAEELDEIVKGVVSKSQQFDIYKKKDEN
ncbi:response regulator [Marivirga sp.]|uniref:response regulator n=1 Tax=Marivirga sp. TaxID=2018662 RepID=UPI002D7F7ECC|nr:response regulator [Marivirga sp.]HET8861076.1 response regulator [Marivirga sp.]